MAEPEPTATEANRPKRPRPTKALPTERISFPKQIAVMRATAIAHMTSGRPVSYTEIANIVNIAPGTLALAFPFWADIGLMERSENAHTPAAVVLAFNRAHDWNPE